MIFFAGFVALVATSSGEISHERVNYTITREKIDGNMSYIIKPKKLSPPPVIIDDSSIGMYTA